MTDGDKEVVAGLLALHRRILLEIERGWKHHQPIMAVSMNDASIILSAAITIDTRSNKGKNHD